MPLLPSSLFYAARCKAITDVMKSAEYLCRTAVAPNAFSFRALSRMSWFLTQYSTIVYACACLHG